MMTAMLPAGEHRATIRTELSNRIARIVRDRRSLSLAQLCNLIDSIRREAQLSGLEPARRLAAGLNDALAREGPAAIIDPWLEGLRQAIDCAPDDARAAAAILASVNSRLV